MSTNGFTVNSLATAFADRQLAHQQLAEPQRAQMRNRMEFDFKVTGFNGSTAAAIATLALAIFTSSVAIFVLSAIVYNIRHSFMRAVEETALLRPDQQAVDPDLLQRVANLNPVQRRNEIAAHLDIHDENWKVVQYQRFDFKVWMNWTPVAPAVARVDAPIRREAEMAAPAAAVAAPAPAIPVPVAAPELDAAHV